MNGTAHIQRKGQRLRLQPCEMFITVDVRGATFRHIGGVTAVSPVHIFIRFIRRFFFLADYTCELLNCVFILKIRSH